MGELVGVQIAEAQNGAIRPDILNRAIERAQLTEVEKRERGRVYTARALYHLALDVDPPAGFIDPAVEQDREVNRSFARMSLPLPSGVPKRDFDLQSSLDPNYIKSLKRKRTLWIRKAQKELDKWLPQLSSLGHFDAGKPVVGDRTKMADEDIVERMADVMLGPNRELVAFDFKLSELVAQGFISQKKWRTFQELTRLGDVRYRILVHKDHYNAHGKSLRKAIENAAIIYKGEMGITSRFENLGELPWQVLNEVRNGVVIAPDVFGMGESPLKNPVEIDTNTYLDKVQAHNFAMLAFYHLLGFDKPSLAKKPELMIAHSKEAAARLLSGRVLGQPDRGQVLLAPVFEHPFPERVLARLGLALGSQVASITDITKFIADWIVSPELIKQFIPTGSLDERILHWLNYRNTDKMVIGKMMWQLLKTTIPYFRYKLPPETTRIFLFDEDMFIMYGNVLKRLREIVEDPEQIIGLTDGHYGFSAVSEDGRMIGDEAQVRRHRENQAVVVRNIVEVSHHLMKAKKKRGGKRVKMRQPRIRKNQ